MKILKHTVSLLIVLALFISCNDDNGNDPNPPSATAPETQNVLVGESLDLTFSISVDAGYESASVSAANGEASISSEPESGATSGDIVVSYTGNTTGAGSVELTVTDVDGLTAKATAVINVGEEQKEFTITENITEDTTWEDGKTYILGGRIIVEPDVTLTIEGGAVVKGEAGSGSNATTLLVARDATLNANGTAQAPIIFTSVADEITPEDVDNGNFGSPNLDETQNGLWGGVIVLGNAPISYSDDGNDQTEAQIEGIPTSETLALYGGNDPSDSSGSLTYVTIRHGGTNIGQGNEINGLSLGGVGNGTTIENIEIVANQDDGVEWFGGTVNVSNVLVWNNGDDALDTDQDWQGTVDNVVTMSPDGSSMELDGPEGSSATVSGNAHTIMNVSAYVETNGSELIDVDDNTNVNISNVVFFGLATDDSGNADNMFSSDYSEYADNTKGYTITSIDAVLPSGTALADYFPQSLVDDGEVEEVADAQSGTGADTSVFGWTWASQAGALSNVGL
ncbi:hypothetical protein CK503_13200 [Aliifodinibius salipaludis]|uniref:Right handed beta helix domain-containing protein n=1 Tax=Fodinibius salipaludis TaxID=2032627 RepID=A0A2A2G7M7_9BACT|nr:hypothetical protein [Aliifodinibius salipaludis]PAU93120.1 hypothetical protein CK503_13200 [Aliifodinibius salipaludis]